MRKYNNTGHFRLLNQLRNELKKNPIVRPKSPEASEINRNNRTVEVRPQHPVYQNRTARRSPTTEAASTASSFRERLNAIEMR
ncbi:MAG: hypothetical protein CBB79_02805 [Synechococcus sp. TMED19]|nr:MAG: hypothetical protein CBB79_02805 [Synechococcus sp. TMED19]